VLSSQALADRYRVEGVGNVVLPKFAFFELPQNYLALAMPPYSLDILNSESDLALCLLTGKVVTLYRLGTRIPWIIYHLRQTCREGNSVFLVLTGSRATSVFIGSASFVAFLPVRGFYLDACGDEDPGLKNGRLLNLSMDRLSQVQDLFMSGAWTDLLAKSLPLDHIPPSDSDLS
jgi:hypothetical protein